MIQATYDTEYFVKWLFGQGTQWLDSRGNMHEIRFMPRDHAFNACVFLQRTVGDVYYSRFGRTKSKQTMSEWLISTPTFQALKERALDESPRY